MQFHRSCGRARLGSRLPRWYYRTLKKWSVLLDMCWLESLVSQTPLVYLNMGPYPSPGSPSIKPTQTYSPTKSIILSLRIYTPSLGHAAVSPIWVLMIDSFILCPLALPLFGRLPLQLKSRIYQLEMNTSKWKL